MQLTDKEEKIARLALDKGAQPGERESAAIKLINSLHARGITVEDIEKVVVREKVIMLKVASPASQPTVARKVPRPAPRPAYTAPEPTPVRAKKDIPGWKQVAALLIVIIAMIKGFAGMAGQPSHPMQSPRVSESPQVSTEPAVHRAQFGTSKETHAKRHPKKTREQR
jgi:hypothetical protein